MSELHLNYTHTIYNIILNGHEKSVYSKWVTAQKVVIIIALTIVLHFSNTDVLR